MRIQEKKLIFYMTYFKNILRFPMFTFVIMWHTGSIFLTLVLKTDTNEMILDKTVVRSKIIYMVHKNSYEPYYF